MPTLKGASKQDQKGFVKAIRDAISHIRSKSFADCGKLFGGEAGVGALLGADYSYDTDAQLVSMPGVAAATDESTNSVMINLVGPFFHQVQTVGGQTLDYGKSSGLQGTDFQAFILLHELGHLTGAFGPTDHDATNAQNQNANNTLVLKDCFGKDFNPNP